MKLAFSGLTPLAAGPPPRTSRPSRDTFIDQDVLRASVVHDEEVADRLRASVLLVNAGKNYETLFSARRFIYLDDLSAGGGSMSKEGIGPIVLKPGEAVVVPLDASSPDIVRLREDGTNRQLGVSEDC